MPRTPPISARHRRDHCKIDISICEIRLASARMLLTTSIRLAKKSAPIAAEDRSRDDERVFGERSPKNCDRVNTA